MSFKLIMDWFSNNQRRCFFISQKCYDLVSSSATIRQSCVSSLAVGVIRTHQKNQESHYESRGWYHYTRLHPNCPLSIVLKQQHVFIISEHVNGPNIIRTRLMVELRAVFVRMIRARSLMVWEEFSRLFNPQRIENLTREHGGTTGEITFKPSRCSCAQPLSLSKIWFMLENKPRKATPFSPDRCFKYCWCLSPEHKEQISPRPRGKPPQHQAALKGPSKGIGSVFLSPGDTTISQRLFELEVFLRQSSHVCPSDWMSCIGQGWDALSPNNF